MRITEEELARRFAEADRKIVLLRRTTLEMQRVRRFFLLGRSLEPRRPDRDQPPGR